MSLSPKVHSSFWSDEDIGNLLPVQKLAVLWVITNKDTNNIGYVKAGKRQFEFDTGLTLNHLEGACKELPRSFLYEPDGTGFEVLSLNYIHYQFNDCSLSSKNNIYKNLCMHVSRVNARFQNALLVRYPNLRRGFELIQLSSSPLEGAYKPPEQSRAEQSRAELLMGDARGSAGARPQGGSSDLPSDEEVFAFCLEWPGELATGAPAIPQGYAEEWVAKMSGRTSGWPPDWKRKLKADWRAEFRTWKPKEAASKKKGAWELKEKKAALDQQIRSHPANPDSSAYSGEPTLREEADYQELLSKRKDVERDLAHE